MFKTPTAPRETKEGAPSKKNSIMTMGVAIVMLATIGSMAVASVAQMSKNLQRQSADGHVEFVKEAFVKEPAQASRVSNPSAMFGVIIPAAEAVYVQMSQSSGIVCDAAVGGSGAWLLKVRTHTINPKLPGMGGSYISASALPEGDDVAVFCERARAAL